MFIFKYFKSLKLISQCFPPSKYKINQLPKPKSRFFNKTKYQVINSNQSHNSSTRPQINGKVHKKLFKIFEFFQKTFSRSQRLKNNRAQYPAPSRGPEPDISPRKRSKLRRKPATQDPSQIPKPGNS